MLVASIVTAYLSLVSQVIDVCSAANRRLRIFRARFSALIQRDLQRAVSQLVAPNEADAKAVDARQEIDLRVGASFTRFQTLLLQVGTVEYCCLLCHCCEGGPNRQAA